MKFTFGIITGNGSPFLQEIIESIENEKIPEYEIIIVGNVSGDRPNLRIIQFDERIKPMWITRKKNIITQEAKYENIVYMHDYIKLLSGWYDGFLNYKDDWKICMNRIINSNGERFRDWCLWEDQIPGVGNIGHRRLLPYDVSNLSKFMYFSGSYWVCKKEIMQEFPLDENLIWAQGEDVKWSQQVRQKYNFSMNAGSAVKILKDGKGRVFDFPTPEEEKLIRGVKLD